MAGPTPTASQTSRGAFPKLSSLVLEYLLVLPAGALIALIWVNTAPESYYSFTFPITFVVNDIGMVFFFGLITKEIVEATVPGGVLHPWRRAWLPIIAAIGAAAVPALLYNSFVSTEFVDEPILALAWPVPFATDLALCYLVGRIIFRSHPAIPFLLLLGIAADGLGFITLALLYPTDELHLAVGVAIMATALAVSYGLRKARVKSFWPYILLGGGLSWFALYEAGAHPALALAPILPFLPHAKRDAGFFVDAPEGARDALSRFELWGKYPGQVALFFFGLVNAGVPLGALELGSWAVGFAAITGKPIGLVIAAGAAMALGLHLPPRVGWRELIVVGFLAAMGFSVGLFFAAIVFPPGQLLAETRMGVLLTLFGGVFAVIAAKLLGCRPVRRKPIPFRLSPARLT